MRILFLKEHSVNQNYDGYHYISHAARIIFLEPVPQAFRLLRITETTEKEKKMVKHSLLKAKISAIYQQQNQQAIIDSPDLK